MIGPGNRVKFHYTLKVDGNVIETSDRSTPVEYTHGKDEIILGLQKGLEGHRQGEKCTITVEPEDGYGKIRQELLIEVPKERMPEGEINLGSELTAQNDAGEQVKGRVADIRPETILIDFNHPLAGKRLIFDVEILNVA